VVKKNIYTKTIIILGTVLVWFPILAPVLLALILLVSQGIFRFDFLMPLELFPAELVGGGLLIWAALRMYARKKLIIWSFVSAIAMFILSQAVAVITGLASGDTEPAGLPLFTVTFLVAVCIFSIIALGVGGIILFKKLPA
jgi:hypothetical protein